MVFCIPQPLCYLIYIYDKSLNTIRKHRGKDNPEILSRGQFPEHVFKTELLLPELFQDPIILHDLMENILGRILSFRGKGLPDPLLEQAKKEGFADRYLSQLLQIPEKDIRASRTSLGVVEAWEPVPVSGVEDAAYYFSTYNAPDKVASSEKRKMMVLGGGPNRIG